jgi:hypothetical protein
MGSKHPFVGSSTADMYSKKIREHNKFKKSAASDSDDSLSGVLKNNIQNYEDSIAPYIVSDDQKLLRFFIYGFPNVESILQSWVIVPKKNDKLAFNRLHYYYASKPEIIQNAEDFFSDRTQPLTHAQRMAEWFILRAYHLMATMASRIINSAHPMDDTTNLEMLLSSWFSRSRSTTDMVIGTKNESAIIVAFSRSTYILDVFECGLFESLEHPWLAASPDAIALLKHPVEIIMQQLR